MENDLRAHLVTLAAEYAKLSGLSETTLGRLAAGDWRFFRRLTDGAGFTAAKYDEAVAWFKTHWPENEPWPEAKLCPNCQTINAT